MAVTKIIPVKYSIKACADYICNEKKTDSATLITTNLCSPATAEYDFAFALKQAGTAPHGKTNKGFHLIQSFRPGETSGEEAHQIGNRLVEQFAGKNYSYIVATHVDRGHVHNHILFCAVDNIHHKKFNNRDSERFRLRDISDRLCREAGLSVIPKKRDSYWMDYGEWYMNQSEKSWKQMIRSDIDRAIKLSESYEDFLRILRERGYEIKDRTADGSAELSYLSFRPFGKDRFVRGSEKSLGRRYTRSAIRERITVNEKKEDLLIDVKQERFQKNAVLERWARRQNLKTAAAISAEADSLNHLEEELESKKKELQDIRHELKETEQRMDMVAEVIRYTEQYRENRSVAMEYEKADDTEAFFREHDAELILYWGAEHMLEEMSIATGIVDLKTLRKEYENLKLVIENRQKEYRSETKEVQILNKQKSALEDFLNGLSLEPKRRSQKGKDRP